MVDAALAVLSKRTFVIRLADGASEVGGGGAAARSGLTFGTSAALPRSMAGAAAAGGSIGAASAGGASVGALMLGAGTVCEGRTPDPAPQAESRAVPSRVASRVDWGTKEGRIIFSGQEVIDLTK